MYLTLTVDDVARWTQDERQQIIEWATNLGADGDVVTEARIVAEGRVELTVLGDPPGSLQRITFDSPAPPPFVERWLWLEHAT